MNEKLTKINKIIRESISNNRRIVIYVLNDIGLEIKQILEELYGCSPTVIDDDLSQFNDYIISFEEYKKIFKKEDTIILCSSSSVQTQQIAVKLRELNIVLKDKNVITWPNGYYPEKEKYFRDLKKLLTVKKAVGYDLKRYGRNNDGGYCMLDDFQKCDTAYSFGICDDISWDEDMAANDMEVYCYDHTIDALPHENSYLHFKKIGIGCEDDLRSDLLSFDSILKINGHRNKSGMILKMDIEGAEWSIIRDVPQDILSLFSQISFEFHYVSTPHFLNFRDSLSVFEKLNRTHQVIWIHANNFDFAEESNGITIPNTLEITYANKEQYKFEQTEYNCPLSIDEPNYPVKSDIELKDFGDIHDEKETALSGDAENNKSVTAEAIWIGYLYHTQTLPSDVLTSQLFIDTGEGFTEEKKRISINSVIGEEISSVRFDISDYPYVKGLRFDPVEGHFCEVEIISAVSGCGEIEPIPDVCVRHGNKAIFLNTDPQYYIYSECQTFVEIKFKLRLLTAFESEQAICEYYRDKENYRKQKDAEAKRQSAKIDEQNVVINDQILKLNEQDLKLNNQNSEIEGLKVKLNELTLDIESLNAKLKEQNDVINDQSQKLKDCGSEIDSLNMRLNTQDAVVEDRNARLSEQNLKISEMDTLIEDQKEIIEKQSNRINEQLSTIGNQIASLKEDSIRIKQLNETLQSVQNQDEHLKAEIESLYHSHSWRITAPLRGISSSMKKLLKGKK